MARSQRLDVPGIPFHVIQRGVARSACFHDDRDRRYYLAALRDAAIKGDCRIHAYVLMSNHVHLLTTADSVGGISCMMQSLGRRYVRRFNDRHQRTGTLWEGRFKSSPVDTDRYLLTCYRYIEANPVRAGMVESATEYPWSSARFNGLGRDDPLLSTHPTYEALGIDKASRSKAYRALLDQPVTDQDLQSIRSHLGQCKALGPRRFQEQIEALTGRSATLRRRGRPRNST